MWCTLGADKLFYCMQFRIILLLDCGAMFIPSVEANAVMDDDLASSVAIFA